MGFNKQLLGDILINRNFITEEELMRALAKQENTDKKLGSILVNMGFVSEEEIARALNQQLDFSLLKPKDKEDISEDILQLLEAQYLKDERIFPLRREGNNLYLAMEDPQNVIVKDEVKDRTGMEVIPVIATPSELQELIDRYISEENIDAFVSDVEEMEFDESPEEMEMEGDEDGAELNLEEEDEAAIVRVVNRIIRFGINYRASDIHIEPLADGTRVRYRIDGVLHKLMEFSRDIHSLLVSRIKVMSGLDIAEKRSPQDGSISARFGDVEADLRISILPFSRGEKVVIRIFDKTNVNLSFDFIGFSENNYSRYLNLIQRPNGIILLTGPTGSGKTTTLYTTLNYLNEETKNIVTIEDPVEYQLSGINQATVNEEKGFTFARVLRVFVRQDPDIIMVGEIRDRETAETAIKAALTGHLVFSTLHTNSAAGAVSRLINMGVEPFLLADSIMGVVAQRLVRKICPDCRTVTENIRNYNFLPDDWAKDATIYSAQGCEECGNIGYRGRTAIHELLTISPAIKEAIINTESSARIEKLARKQGMKTLMEDGLNKVRNGNTTLEEVVKVANISGEAI
ncbi:MAG: GspE/PulE family protein [Halanaerobiales bacterium]